MKKLLSICIIVTILSSLAINSFAVVVSNEYRKSFLEKDNHIAYITGDENNYAYPDRYITRAETVTMFVKLMKEKMPTYNTYKPTFKDITANDWFSNYVGYVEDFNFIKGYEDGTFRPNTNITRAEFIALAASTERMDYIATFKFDDVPDDFWAADSINSAYKKGWINGYANNNFRPNDFITKAEAVKVINTMLERKIDKSSVVGFEYNTFKDVPSTHWAYYQFIEASTPHEFYQNGLFEKWYK